MNMKYLILLIVISNFIFSQCDYTIGDSDSNGILDVVDIVAMVNIVLSPNPPSETDLCLADLNQDGIVNVVDIISLVNAILDS